MTRRLHPAGIAVLGLRALRELAVPALIGLAATVGGGGVDGRTLWRVFAFAAVAAVLAALAGLVTWRTVRYSVSETAVTARRGVFSVKETVVPLERVQALDTVQGPLQRLFGVTAVHVQAAGGGREGEIVLEALSAQAVVELREAIGSSRGPAGAGASDGTADGPSAGDGSGAGVGVGASWRLGTGRLLVTALTAGQLGVILPVLAGASQQLDDLLGPRLRSRAGLTDLVPDTAGEVALVAALLLATAWLLSIGGAIVAFSSFSVRRDGDRLLISRGLFARRVASVPLARVQAVIALEGVLRQPFGLVALRVETAGYATEAAAAQTLYPLLRRGEVERFLAEMVPASAGGIAALAPVPGRARRRYVARPTLTAVVAAAAIVFLLHNALAWALAVAVVAAGVAIGLAAHRAAGWQLDLHRVLVRSRVIGRRTVIVPRRRLQEHAVGQTVLQRRAGLASLALAAGAGTKARVAHLDASIARELFERLRSAPAPR